MSPEKIYKILVISLFGIGMLIGFSAAYMMTETSETETSQCQELETEIQEELPYGENTACYTPNHITIEEADVDEVDLKCACRIIYQGEVELYPIYSADVGGEELEEIEELE